MPEALPTTSAGSMPSRVRLINTRQPDDPGMAPKPMAALASTRSSPEFLAQMMPVLTAIAAVAAARMLLLLAMLGAFVLALLATLNPEPYRLVATVIYDLGIVGPLAYLALVKG